MNLKELQSKIEKFVEIKPGEMTNKSRSAPFVRARQLFCIFSARFGYETADIKKYLGSSFHRATVNHSIRSADDAFLYDVLRLNEVAYSTTKLN